MVIHTKHDNNCSCLNSPTCIRQSYINDFDLQAFFVVPGFYEGCYIIESLLQSNLYCLFHQSCIDNLQVFFPLFQLTYVPALNASIPTKYFRNTTMKELLDNLMIEYWNTSTFYEGYYNECQPAHCTYTFQTRNDIIYIATTLFGIAGGLTTVLKLVVPRLVRYVMYCIRKQTTRVVPDVLVVQT
jgi:hypothetical protein